MRKTTMGNDYWYFHNGAMALEFKYDFDAERSKETRHYHSNWNQFETKPKLAKKKTIAALPNHSPFHDCLASDSILQLLSYQSKESIQTRWNLTTSISFMLVQIKRVRIHFTGEKSIRICQERCRLELRLLIPTSSLELVLTWNW